MKVLANNGKYYTKDHPHEIINPRVMRFDEIRQHLRELTTNPEYGWMGYGGKAGLERALGMGRDTLKDKLQCAWIWPKEQVRLTARIGDNLAGRIVPKRFGRSIEGVVTDPPEPPKISEKPRTVKLYVDVGRNGPHIGFAPPPPALKLPDFRNAFRNVAHWNPDGDPDGE